MRIWQLIIFIGAISLGPLAYAQMMPNAPVKNFRFPRFSDQGFTEWVLQGGEGIYDSEEQIRVNEMNLRVYSGDERLAQELGLKSPQATIRLQENRAFSESRILIEGTNFTISGTGWNWNGETKIVEVLGDTIVTFAQAMTNTLSSVGAGAMSAGGKTEVRSDRLMLRTTEAEYEFEFIGEVKVLSGDMRLQSGRLVAVAEAPEGRETKEVAAVSSQIDAIRSLRAYEDVVIQQSDKTARAAEAIFDPNGGRVELIGLPQIEASGAYVSGHQVISEQGELLIRGSQDAGRAQVILTQAGGFGLMGAESLSSETIVLADEILLKDSEAGNEFNFDGSVEVLSGAMQMKSDTMRIEAQKTETAARAQPAEGIAVGEVERVVAEGSVEIERDGQFAKAEKVIFYPDTERAELFGNPVVENGEAKIEGFQMELQPKGAHVRSGENQAVVVTLPVMPDLGYDPMAETDALAAFSAASTVASEQPEGEENPESIPVAPSATVIRSNDLQVTEDQAGMFFLFSENVAIDATNLEATCDRLEVRADRTEGSGIQAMEVSSIDAIDAVRFVQSGRTATANKAMIRPKEGKVILEGDAMIVDERGKVTGHRMILNQGQRRAVVEGDGTGETRAKITLPALPIKKP